MTAAAVTSSSHRKAYAALALGVFAIGWSALFVRWSAVPGWTSAFWRMTLAQLVFVPWALASRREGAAHMPSRAAVRDAIIAGVFFAADLALFNTAVMCTPSPIRVLRSAQVVELIAIATPRTVEAGAGPVEPKDQSDRPIRRPGPIFGQVVRAQRVHVDYLQRLGLRSPSQPVDVVVVPWGSNGSCSRMIVPGRGPWFDAGSRALIFGELRERRHWVGGRPTIDLTDVIPDPGTSAVADACRLIAPKTDWRHSSELSRSRSSSPAGRWSMSSYDGQISATNCAGPPGSWYSRSATRESAVSGTPNQASMSSAGRTSCA